MCAVSCLVSFHGARTTTASCATIGSSTLRCLFDNARRVSRPLDAAAIGCEPARAEDTASLDAPPSISAGSAVPVKWTGPPRQYDDVALFPGGDSKQTNSTPIAASLEAVASALSQARGERLAVIIPDGEETCGGDPVRAIQRLQHNGVGVRVNSVGFAIDDAKLAATFRLWSSAGHGTYVDVRDAATLDAAVAQALKPRFEIEDHAKTPRSRHGCHVRFEWYGCARQRRRGPMCASGTAPSLRDSRGDSVSQTAVVLYTCRLLAGGADPCQRTTPNTLTTTPSSRT